MHKFTLSLHGGKAGTPPPSDFKPVKFERGDVEGWSHKSARNNADWLRSVDFDALDGLSYSFTGTIKDCPPTSADWHSVRRSFIERLRRRGLIRAHWVTEWQRRGVPHLHGALWFPSDIPPAEVMRFVVEQWLAVTKQYGSTLSAQHMNVIYDALGWAQYTCKHAARGVTHYQRSPENIPVEWRYKTGRVWGKVGDWVVCEPFTLQSNSEVFWRYRRLVRAWRKADARKSGNPFRIKKARTMLRCSKIGLSRVRGVNEWLSLDDSLLLLHCAGENSSYSKIEQVWSSDDGESAK